MNLVYNVSGYNDTSFRTNQTKNTAKFPIKAVLKITASIELGYNEQSAITKEEHRDFLRLQLTS